MFDESCMEKWVDEPFRSNYREIYFNGDNFSDPSVQLCASILLSGQNGSDIRGNNEYSLYFEGRYGLMNISELHSWMLDNGYFRKANICEALRLYTIPELKIMLDSLGLKKSGKKEDLINRIVAALDNKEKELITSQCAHVFPTEKGYEFLDCNSDLVMFHKKSYGLYFWEFKKHRILEGRKRRFYDTIFQALSTRNYVYLASGCYMRLEMNYLYLSDCTYDEGRYGLALQNILYRLYFSANQACHFYYFVPDFVESKGLDATAKRIVESDSFNQFTVKRIKELKPYFKPFYIDAIYESPMLPYCIFDKVLFSEAVDCMYNEEYFDSEYFTILIRENYIKLMKEYIRG